MKRIIPIKTVCPLDLQKGNLISSVIPQWVDSCFLNEMIQENAVFEIIDFYNVKECKFHLQMEMEYGLICRIQLDPRELNKRIKVNEKDKTFRLPLRKNETTIIVKIIDGGIPEGPILNDTNKNNINNNGSKSPNEDKPGEAEIKKRSTNN